MTRKTQQSEDIQNVISACRHAFYYVGFFSMLVNLLILTVPIYMLQIYDRVLPSQSYDTLIFLTLIAIVALMALSVLDIARNQILAHLSRWLDNRLSPMALSRSADMQLAGSAYGAQSLSDIRQIRSFMSSPSMFVLFDAPWSPFYILFIFFLHYFLGIVAVIAAVVLFGLGITVEIVSRKPLAGANSQDIENQKQIDTMLSNAEAIQAMGILPNITKHWFRKNEVTLNLQSKANSRIAYILSLSKFFRLSAQIAVLGIGAFFVVRNELTAGAMIAASIILSRALAPVEQSVAVWRQMVSVHQAYTRLKNYLQSPRLRVEGKIELPKPQGSLSLENAAFMPIGFSKPIVQGINLKLKPGEMIIILGPSGAGKSTLARLMLGIWKPNYGSVRLDNADVYQWDRAHFGKHVGYLPQSIELLPGNIKQNIARMDDSAKDEDIIAAAQMAGAHDLILQLPAGYETNTSMYSLSGGQKQRIALSRAFYGEPAFMVLDEPGASLDREGNLALQRALKTLKQRQVTSVIISHRTDIIQFADTLLVLVEGTVKMLGPRDTVLQELKKQQEGSAS